MPTNNTTAEISWPEEAHDNNLIENYIIDDDESDDQDEDWIENNDNIESNDNDNSNNYVLLSQNPDSENDQRIFYQHNYEVEWITTDEPLFDRELFERQQQSNNGNNQDQNSSSSSTADNNLDKEKIDTIKTLMSNFKIPEENIPNWAKNIPEEDWKKCLENKLKNV